MYLELCDGGHVFMKKISVENAFLHAFLFTNCLKRLLLHF